MIGLRGEWESPDGMNNKTIALTTAHFIDYSLVYKVGCLTLLPFFERTFQAQDTSYNNGVVYCLSSIIPRMNVDNAENNIGCLSDIWDRL